MLIFDMDGTLIDSNGIWRQVDEAFLAKRGYPYTREYYEGVAHTIFPMAAKFTKAYCHLEESEEEIMAEWMQMAGDAYAVRVPIKPGVRAYLDRCRAAGERMIVLTSSVPEHCRAALGRLGLTEYFERILFAHDLGMDKKDPETFRHAAALMGVTPEDCTMYDDSVAACRAGEYRVTVDIPAESAPAELDLDAIYDEICTAPVDDSLDMTEYRFVPGSYGYSFDLDAAKAALAQAKPGETVSVPMTFVEPEILGDAVYFRDGSHQTGEGRPAAAASGVFERLRRF